MPATDWKTRITPLDAREQDNPDSPLIVTVLYGAEVAVGLDLTDALDAGEEPENVSVNIQRLRNVAETADAAANDKKNGAHGLIGNTVSQPIHNLERNRYYRMEVLFGPSNNRRGHSLLIRCPE